MKAHELMKYIYLNVTKIMDKYKKVNVCNVGPDMVCLNTKISNGAGTGCCFGCQFHNKKIGCTIINLCCAAYFCDKVKNHVEPEDWITLKSVIVVLQGLGFEPRMSWEKQKQNFILRCSYLDCSVDDVFFIFQSIFNRNDKTSEHNSDEQTKTD